MKTRFDPRHRRRIKVVFDLFRWSFKKQKIGLLAKKIINCMTQVDEMIKKAAPEWPVDKIAKIDLAILRLAVYELSIVRQVPPKVIIDEAVELAKEFGSEKSASFVNGALGAVLRWQSTALRTDLRSKALLAKHQEALLLPEKCSQIRAKEGGTGN